jgi:Domain of unknown function DUF11/FG-GAP-like repeat/Putative binding domain, N-terminal
MKIRAGKIWLTISLALCGLSQIAAAQRIGTANWSAPDACASGNLSGAVTIHAPQSGTPFLNFCDGHALSGNLAQMGQPVALASADFDGDGVPDLVSGFSTGKAGKIMIHRGNVNALWPYGAALRNGPPPAFLTNPRSFSLPESPDFLVTGDFDADGHWDIVTAQRGSNAIYFLKGDGRGGFAAPKRIALPGNVTAMIAGEINRADGLADLIVAVSIDGGARVMVYESPTGAIAASPEVFKLAQPATALALGQFDGSAMNDLAAASGNQLVVIHARDRKLSSSQTERASVPRARITAQKVSFDIQALAAGDFIGAGPSIAALGDDGQIHILEHALAENNLLKRMIADPSFQPTIATAKPDKDGKLVLSGGKLTPSQTARLEALRQEAHAASEGPEWTEKNTVALPAGFTQASPKLVAARVSGSLEEDILAPDSGNNRLHVFSTISQTHRPGLMASNRSAVTPASMKLLASMEAESAPAAVLPMRLSKSGLQGLVTLQDGISSPIAMQQTIPPSNIFTVTNTSDAILASSQPTQYTGPAGSLRAAMFNANYTTGPAEVVFNIPTTDPGYNPATGTFLFQPLSQQPPGADNVNALPSIYNTVIIDGYTQPGASPNTAANADNAKILIQIDGGKATTPGGTGLSPFDDTGSTFRGLDFTGWTNAQVSNDTASGGEGIEAGGVGDYIEGNFFGTDPTGTLAADPKTGKNYSNRIGVFADAGPAFGNTGGGTVIGGTTPGARNILSNNGVGGILFLSTALQGRLEGNFIGLDASGAKALPNTDDGAGSNGPTIVIGGTLAGDGNVISANGTNVDFNDITNGGQASNSMAQGNLIGTDATGTISVSKVGGNGVSITYGPTDETIGGTTPAARNVISGNYYGVVIENDTTGNFVQGNFIGTDFTGTLPIGNTQQGFYQTQTDSNSTAPINTVLGGATAGAGNLISGNVLDGVSISGTVADSEGALQGSTILGNYIGTDVTGTKAVPNGATGISLLAGATNNVIGGTVPSEGNVISYNTSHGVLIDSASNGTGNGNNTVGNTIQNNGGTGVRINSGVNNLISRNSIYQNGALGIELGTAGKNLNTTCNATNTGPNNSQNAPVLTGSATTSAFYTATATDPNGNTSEFSNAVKVALTSGNMLDLVGSFNSVASTTYTIEFFSSPTDDPSGYGQGQTYIGSTQVTTGTDCSAPVSSSSNPDDADLSITLTGPAYGLQIGPDFGDQVYTATVTNLGPATATGVVVTDTLPAGLAISSLYCNVGPCQSSITTNFGSCTVSGQIVTCSLGTMAAGQTAAVTIPVQALTAGSIVDVATVKSAVTDPVMSNNTSSLTEAVTYPEPFIDYSSNGQSPNIEPDSVLAGSPNTLVTIYGTGFLPSSTVSLNNTNLPVVSFADNQLCSYFTPYYCAAIEVNVPASLLTTAGTPTITVTNPDPGEGGGPNTPSTATFNIVSACSFTVDPYSDLTDSSVLDAGGTDPIAEQVGVAANAAGCTWTGSSSVDWVVPLESAPVVSSFTQYGGALSTVMDFAVAPNSSSTTRNGTITIAGQVFSFSQAGGAPCDYKLSSNSGNFTAAGGAGSFGVTIDTIQSGALCSPGVETNFPGGDSGLDPIPPFWITVPFDYVPSNGTVTFNVAANTGPPRTGTIMVGGYVYTVNQAAPPCYYTVNPNTALWGAAGGSGTFDVIASAASCAWTATSSNTSDVSVTSGASGTGNGTVKYTVSTNKTGPQTPTITIADTKGGSTPFTINQASDYTCTFTLSPASVELPASGGSNFFGVTASNGICSWTATSNNPSAVAISGTQSNAVLYTVGQNPSTQPRTLTITAGCETFTIIQDGTGTTNPVPAITTLQPSGTTAGSGAFTLTVNGSNFVSGAVVNFNGNARTTTFVSATKVTAAILAADIASAGTPSVTVTNPAPGGGTSNALTFTITSASNPAPALTSLQPSTATAGSGAFTLTVNGSSFVSGAVVNFNGAARTTTFVSATKVTAAILAADIASTGTPSVTVTNPAPGGGTSNALTFAITAANNPTPAISSLQPSTATAGSGAFTLTVNGSSFVSGAVVNFSGAARTTTFVSATKVTAAILAADIASTGTPSVTVTNPAPGGGTSNALTFAVTNPVPVANSLQPTGVIAGSGAFTLTVNGLGFVSGAVVNFNGSPRTTTFVNGGKVTAAILATDVATAGSPSVTVTNPAPGGGTSNALTFSIAASNNPTPAITTLQPASAPARSGAFTLTVNGSSFVNGAIVNFNGNPRTTAFVSATKVTAAIVAGDVLSAGTPSVTVTNPAPGGGTSNALTFTITAAAKVTPTVAVTPSASSITTAQALTVTIAVNGGSGNPTPTGSVTLTSGSYTSASTVLSSGAATINIPAGSLATGADTLTVTYTPDSSSSSTYSSATGTNTVAVTVPPVQVTVGTAPAGLAFSVDGTTYTGTQSLSWTAGSSHTIATTSPQTSAGTQNTFAAWSDGGAISHTVTASSSTTSYTASFSTAYQLMTAANPASEGTVSPASGVFYAAGSTVNLVATPNAGFMFNNWTGNVASASSASTTISMNTPQSVTANFGAIPVPVASLTPTSLSFTAQTGATSAAQTATLKNTGNAALNISSITLTGANPTDFAQTNTCGESLAAGASCSIAITFTPASAASFAATVSIADNAAGSPQTVSLTGTGTAPPPPTFTITSSTTAQTVQPGGAAQYSITVTPQNGAYSNPVTFSATGLPSGATATFSPASLTPGSSVATSQLTIQTVATTPVTSGISSAWPLSLSLLPLFGMFFGVRKLRRRWLTLAVLLIASLGALTALSGCGGGFGLTTSTNYSITVTGTSGAIQQTTTVQLTVQ